MVCRCIVCFALATMFLGCSGSKQVEQTKVASPPEQGEHPHSGTNYMVIVDSVSARIADDTTKTKTLYRGTVVIAHGPTDGAYIMASLDQLYLFVPSIGIRRIASAVRTDGPPPDRELETDENGAQYYINSSGTRTYVRKK